MDDKFNIDDLYRQRMMEFESAPAMGSFDKVMNKLASRRKKRVIAWFVTFGLLGSVSAFFLFTLPLGQNTVENYSGIKSQETNSMVLNNSKKNTPEPKQGRNGVKNKTVQGEFPPTGSKIKSPAGNVPLNEHDMALSSSPGTTSPEVKPINENDTEPASPTTSASSPGMQQAPEVITEEILNTRLENKDENVQVVFLNPTETPALNSDMETIDDSGFLNGPSKQQLQVSNQLNRPHRFVIIGAMPLQFKHLFSSNAAYSAAGNLSKEISEKYLSNRKLQNQYETGLMLSVRAGLNYRNKWELSFSGSFVRFRSYENVYPLVTQAPMQSSSPTLSLLSTPVVNGVNQGGQTYSSGAANKDGNHRYVNSFAYTSFGVGITRLFRIGRHHFTGGTDIYYNYLARSQYILVTPEGYSLEKNTRRDLNPVQMSIVLKAGYHRQINRAAGFRITPGFIMTPFSMFRNDYVINQKLFGFGLEGSLYFRITR